MNQEDRQRNYALAENLISEQNFVAAVIAGAVATVLAAVIYGITTVVWNFSYGFAAVGIGIAVGISMQYLGRGIRTSFTVVASVYTIVGCALGNLFRTIMYLAREKKGSHHWMLSATMIFQTSLLRRFPTFHISIWYSGVSRYGLPSFL